MIIAQDVPDFYKMQFYATDIFFLMSQIHLLLYLNVWFSALTLNQYHWLLTEQFYSDTLLWITITFMFSLKYPNWKDQWLDVCMYVCVRVCLSAHECAHTQIRIVVDELAYQHTCPEFHPHEWRVYIFLTRTVLEVTQPHKINGYPELWINQTTDVTLTMLPHLRHPTRENTGLTPYSQYGYWHTLWT